MAEPPSTTEDPPAPDSGTLGDRIDTGAPRRRTLLDCLALSLLALALRLPAYFSARHLTFDDGVFASSVLAMREGGLPFRDVFSSQGPMFLPLAYLGDLAGGRTLDSPRVLAVVSGIVITIGLYWCGRQIGDRSAGLLAGALGATSGSLIWVTGPLAADGPALAFAVLAFGVALRLRTQRSWPLAVTLGALIGATLSTKSLEAPIVVPVAMVLLAPLLPERRSPSGDRESAPTTPAPIRAALAQALVAGACAVAVFLAVTLPFGFAEVWDQSFRYRSDAAADRDPLANASKLISTLWDRDLVLLLFLVLTLVAVLSGRRSPPPTTEPTVASDGGAPDAVSPSGRVLVAAWTITSAVWLVLVVSPLWRPHVSAMVPPLALLVAAWRPTLRIALIAAIVSVPLLWVQLDGLLVPGRYRSAEADIVAALEELPPGAWGLSDEPGLLWRAGVRTIDDLVDPSMLRVQQGRYDEDSLVAAAADTRVCAVVVRSEDRFGAFPGLGDRLEALGYSIALRDGRSGRLYLRDDCAPTG